jgi:hypothetical protein
LTCSSWSSFQPIWSRSLSVLKFESMGRAAF